ncbi:MAG: CPBP family glutamic-type intramembrane protease [Terracidiphilus sp.]|jgi:hypothetical protein
MAFNTAFIIEDEGNSGAERTRRRDLVEFAVAYALILLVIWMPRLWQHRLWWVAATVIVAIAARSFDGLKAMGLKTGSWLRSLAVVGGALLASAVAVVIAVRLHTLRIPGSPMLFIEAYTGYALWAFVQQFLLQCFFLSRLLRLLPNVKLAVAAAAVLFAVAHLPNPILTPITLLWGLAACLLFLRDRNLYALGMAHAIAGISIAIAVPGPLDHNMRVGMGYLTYVPTHKIIPSVRP